ncbi:MAG: 2-oxoglutarate and iron-dependent oxygenase domain-containing protein, partial [Granulosicoccaceae bacterium]
MNSTPTTNTTDTIPVVDLAPLLDRRDPQSVAKALHRASSEVGFIYVKNHGIDPELINAARQAAFQFFRQSESEKLEVAVSPQHRGFLRVGGAKMADDKQPDLKESFIWG